MNKNIDALEKGCRVRLAPIGDNPEEFGKLLHLEVDRDVALVKLENRTSANDDGLRECPLDQVTRA